MNRTRTAESTAAAVALEGQAPARWAWNDLKDRVVSGNGLAAIGAAILGVLEQARAWVEGIDALAQQWPYVLFAGFTILTAIRVHYNAKKRIKAVLRRQEQQLRQQQLEERARQIEKATNAVAPYSRVPEEDRDPGHDLPRFGWIRLSDAHEMVRVSAHVLIEEFREQCREGCETRNQIELIFDRERLVRWLAFIGK